MPTSMTERVLYFVISYLLLCIGIALSNRCGLPIIPTDLFPRELSEITSIKYSRIKVFFDVICLTVTALMTGLILGHLDGLGIGTILAAFTMGKVIGWSGEWMDQHVRFVSFLSNRAWGELILRETDARNVGKCISDKNVVREREKKH